MVSQPRKLKCGKYLCMSTREMFNGYDMQTVFGVGSNPNEAIDDCRKGIKLLLIKGYKPNHKIVKINHKPSIFERL